MSSRGWFRSCEMQGCSVVATHYGGYPGAGDWAGYVCKEHAERLAWSEEVKIVEPLPSSSSPCPFCGAPVEGAPAEIVAGLFTREPRL